jgi:hypothetical protein
MAAGHFFIFSHWSMTTFTSKVESGQTMLNKTKQFLPPNSIWQGELLRRLATLFL